MSLSGTQRAVGVPLRFSILVDQCQRRSPRVCDCEIRWVNTRFCKRQRGKTVKTSQFRSQPRSLGVDKALLGPSRGRNTLVGDPVRQINRIRMVDIRLGSGLNWGRRMIRTLVLASRNSKPPGEGSWDRRTGNTDSKVQGDQTSLAC